MEGQTRYLMNRMCSIGPKPHSTPQPGITFFSSYPMPHTQLVMDISMAFWFFFKSAERTLELSQPQVNGWSFFPLLLCLSIKQEHAVNRKILCEPS